MRHIWLLGVGGALGGLLCYGYSARTSAAEADPLDNVLTQLPDAASIRQELATKPALTQTERQNLFAELFTQRFRAHDAKVAIRARFVDAVPGNARIKMMYPARMEPWNMDRIALVAWRESKVCLGRSYDIDLYETYIGALPHKIGELHTSGDKTQTASIRYISEAERSALALIPSLFPRRMHVRHRGSLQSLPPQAPWQARGMTPAP
jgi:hypothetical protein